MFSWNSGRLALVCLSMVSASAFAGGIGTSTAWRRTTWKGEPAWVSVRGKVRAVVSEARCRLVYLGAADGTYNLLNAPDKAPMPDAGNVSPNWGGHRFWLGPQKRWVWPAPNDWEHAAAKSVSDRDGVLVLDHPHTDPHYPALRREYAWDGDRLRCTVSWKDDGRPYYGMHVVAVNVPFKIVTRLVRWEEVPDGVVDVQMRDPRATGVLPNPCVQVQGDRATVTAGIKTLKSGYAPQALTVERPGGWELSMIPGPHEGVAITSPDFGYLSQVWVGGPEYDLAEIEQLTPYLIGDRNGRCSSTIYLEALPPVAR